MQISQLPIFFLAKDMGTARMMPGLIRTAVQLGMNVDVCALGLAYDYFRDQRISCIPGMGTSFAEATHFAYYRDAFVRFFAEGEGILVVGEARPAHELIQAMRAARLYRDNSCVRIVQLQDFWNGQHRMFKDGVGFDTHACGVAPDLLCVTDSMAYDLVKKDDRMRNTAVTIVGHPQIRTIKPSFKVQDLAAHFADEYDRVVLYAGCAEATEEEMRLFAACVRKTSGRTMVLLGFHPKLKEQHARWEVIARDVFEHCYVTERGTTDDWAVCVSKVFSGSSTTLILAAYHGRIAVSLDTDATRRYLKRVVCLDRFPCAHVHIDEPISLDDIDSRVQEFLLFPYSDVEAWRSIERIVNQS